MSGGELDRTFTRDKSFVASTPAAQQTKVPSAFATSPSFSALLNRGSQSARATGFLGSPLVPSTQPRTAALAATPLLPSGSSSFLGNESSIASLGGDDLESPRGQQQDLHALTDRDESHHQDTVLPTVFRRLANESHAVYQALHAEGAKWGPRPSRGLEGYTQCMEYSMKYRAVLGSCLEFLFSSNGSNEEIAVVSTLSQIMHLSEIMFMRLPVISRSAGLLLALTPYLKEWVQLSAPDLSSEPNNWSKYYRLLLRGQTAELVDHLFAQRHTKGMGELIDILKSIPDSTTSSSSVDFYTHWHHWQENIEALKISTMDEHILKMVRILQGDLAVYQSLVNDDGCLWYEALIGKLLFTNPTMTVFDLDADVKRSANYQTNATPLDTLLQAIFRQDIRAVVRLIFSEHRVVKTWWLSAHLLDLLHVCGELGDGGDDHTYGHDGHDSHGHGHGHDGHGRHGGPARSSLAKYIDTLDAYPTLWNVAVTYRVAYSTECAKPDVTGLSKFLLNVVQLNPSKQRAIKVINVCASLHLEKLACDISKYMGEMALERNQPIIALWWFVRSKDAISISEQVDVILKEYLKTGVFPAGDVIETFNQSTPIATRLFFIVKYSEFLRKQQYIHHKANNNNNDTTAKKRVVEASAILVKLFDYIPQWFWLTLFRDALNLLEHTDLLFGVQETYELLNKLEKLQMAFNPTEQFPFEDEQLAKQQDKHRGLLLLQADFYKFTDVEGKDAYGSDRITSFLAQIRLALSRNLARALVQSTPTLSAAH